MKFFNPKEEVIDIELTQEGKRLLAQGRFRPEYYAFFDEDVLYDVRYADYAEEQNKSLGRIKDDTPRLKVHYNRHGVESSFKKLKEQKLFERDISNESLDRNEGILPIGTSTGNKYVPAWNIRLADGEIVKTSQYYSGSWGYSNIPQLSASMEVKTEVEFDELRIQGSLGIDTAGIQGRPLSNPEDASTAATVEQLNDETYDDGSYLVTSQPSIIIDISEMNNDFENKNFEIEVFEILQEEIPNQNDISKRELLRPLWFVDNTDYDNVTEDALEDKTQLVDPDYSEHYVHVHVDGELDEDAMDKLFGRKQIGMDEASPYGYNSDLTDDELKEPC